jgi:hypothetical protein
VRRHAKASSAGSIEGNGNGRGRFDRSFATRGLFGGGKGSGARSLGFVGFALLLAGLCTALLMSSAMAATSTLSYKCECEFVYGAGGGGPQGVAVEPGTGNVASADAAAGVVRLSGPIEPGAYRPESPSIRPAATSMSPTPPEIRSSATSQTTPRIRPSRSIRPSHPQHKVRAPARSAPSPPASPSIPVPVTCS